MSIKIWTREGSGNSHSGVLEWCARRSSTLEKQDKRSLRDRREKPTPPLSRYSFLGRRKNLRRKTDQRKGGYTDRYSTTLFFFLVLLVGLNILDSLFTMMILDQRGIEVNPVVRAAIALHGDRFWIWKFALVSFCLVILCLHSKFRVTRGVVFILSSIYLLVVLYQLFLLTGG